MSTHKTKSSYGLRKSQLRLGLSASRETTSEVPGKSLALETSWGDREKQCVILLGTASDGGSEERLTGEGEATPAPANLRLSSASALPLS